jgi:glyoxylate reductase
MPPGRAELVELAAGCDGLLTLLTDQIDGDLLDRLPTVRVVSNLAVGYDNINVPAATERGVAVCTTPDVLTETTADFAFALLLASARRVVDSANAVRQGEWRVWEPMGYLGLDIAGGTIGIVGLGRIGTAMARRARGFGMRVLYSGRAAKPNIEAQLGAKFVSLAELLHESDFVSLHVPLTKETRHLIGAHELSQMKSTAILINSARGPLIDTEALADAVEAGRLWGAALDVTDPEPIPAAHRLVTMTNVLITPHIASATQETRGKMAELAARNLLAVLNGQEPPRCLNPEVLARARR